MIEIIPAIMPTSFPDFQEKLELVKGLVSTVQIDVMDGKFVPERNWPLNESPNGPFAQVLKEEAGLPLWDEFDFEADLMVFEPQQVVDNWVVAGAKRVILHIESVKDFGALLSTLRGSYPRAGADSIGIEIGVALNPDTPNESIYPFLDELDFVQFMGIQKIGYQGQKFDERVLGKIAELRAKYPQCIISVDGAVSTETAPRLMKAGANRLAVGSAIFANESPRQAIEQLQSLEY